MTPDLATFRALYPEFASVADAAVQVQLTVAGDELDQGAWGLCYAKAVLTYAAHMLALSQARVAAAQVVGAGVVLPPTGQVQSAGAEGLTVSFAVPQGQGAAAAWYSQTPYGQAFLAYQRQCLSRGRLSW